MLEKIRTRLPLKTHFFILVPLIFIVTGCSSDNTTAPGSSGVAPDCTYDLEIDNKIRIVAPGHPQDGKEFVLIKHHAYIPAWKVWSGYGGGEMAEIGVTDPHSDTPSNPDGFGRRVFVGLGHCNSVPDPYNCVDPLPAMMLFIVPDVAREGAEPPDVIPGPGNEDDDDFWWDYNGYFDLSQLPANPTNDDLPCWVKECIDGDVRRSTCPVATTADVAAAAPPNFVVANNISKVSPPPAHWDEIEDKSYTFLKEIIGGPAGDPSGWAEEVGTYAGASETFSVWYDTSAGELLLDFQEGDGSYYLYQEIDASSGERPTLQLDMFLPERKFRYEWWTPSCKPVIYLYPEEPQEVSIILKPFGIITESIPEYPNLGGWQNIFAQPDGSLVYEGEEYESLYYEGKILALKVPRESFVLKQEDLEDFFDWILPKLGLNEKEASDFMKYWLSRLNDEEKYYLVTLIPREEIDRVEPMEISSPVDTLLRIRFYFKELAEPIKVNPLRLDFNPPKREGFTVVDWGGFYKGK